MNISDLKESDFAAKQESTSKNIISKPNLTTSSWSRLKDPRIVRVSRAFGGKDRHSKVCTVRGLRDRRVRLSVPTAIQLYDLQDRLGLNQPSKVVDWLLNAAKNEIDELPPLQIPSNFSQSLQTMLSSSHNGEKVDHQGVKLNANSLNWEDYWNKDGARETSVGQKVDDQENGNKHDNNHGTFVQSNNFFERNNQGLLNNVMPNGTNFLKWDPSNLSLSQFGSYELGHDHHQQDDAVHNFNMNSASGSQLLVYPPQTQSYFPNSDDHNSGEFDSKQLNFHMLGSSSSSQNPLSSTSNFTPPLYTINQGMMRPNYFHLSMNHKLFSSEPNGENESNK